MSKNIFICDGNSKKFSSKSKSSVSESMEAIHGKWMYMSISIFDGQKNCTNCYTVYKMDISSFLH